MQNITLCLHTSYHYARKQRSKVNKLFTPLPGLPVKDHRLGFMKVMGKEWILIKDLVLLAFNLIKSHRKEKKLKVDAHNLWEVKPFMVKPILEVSNLYPYCLYPYGHNPQVWQAGLMDSSGEIDSWKWLQLPVLPHTYCKRYSFGKFCLWV